jgi:hypothetical protein
MVRTLASSLVLICAGVAGAADDHKLSQVKQVPDGLAKSISEQLNPAGWQVAGPKGPVCTIWLAREIPVKPDFKPTLSVKYPFLPGQLIGVLKVAEGVKYTDFRGQQLAPGLYTFRYGQQPEDGNHIGTSELADFLLAIPAKADMQADKIGDTDQLHKVSAKAAGSTHPAIFSMLPGKTLEEKASLSHDADHDFWILTAPVAVKAGDDSLAIPLRFVVIGEGLE